MLPVWMHARDSHRPGFAWRGRISGGGCAVIWSPASRSTALLLPQGMAYAELAGLPPVTGLYTTVVALLAYAVFGPSRILVLGPDSAIAPLIAAAVLPLVGAQGDPGKAVALAGALALLIGVLCITAGFARLGALADLFSKPVRIGFLNGIALVVLVSQLPTLFGFRTDATGLLRRGGGLRPRRARRRHRDRVRSSWDSVRSR